jgi:hypothetical protein
VLTVRSGAHALRGVAFKKAGRAQELAMGVPLDVVYSPRWNTFRGETRLELEVLDFAARA